MEQRTSPRSDEPASAPCSTSAGRPANSETAPVNPTIPESPSTSCDSPASSHLSLPSIPSSVEESFDVLPPQQDDAAILDMIAYLVDQNFVQEPATPLSPTFAASPVSPSKSTFSSDSDSSIGDGPDTPVDGNVGELFNVEAGCGTSSSGFEYLSHAELEALLDERSIEDVNSYSSAPALELCEPMPRDLEALFNYPLMTGNFTSIVDGSSNWDINQTSSLAPMFTNIF